MRAWHEVMLELLGVLEILDDKERRAEQDRENQVDDLADPRSRLRRADREHHRERAADQDGRVEAAHAHIQMVAGRRPRIRVPVAVQDVGHEQAAEEHDFGDQKHPHPQRGRFELLVHAVESGAAAADGVPRRVRRRRASAVRSAPYPWCTLPAGRVVVRRFRHNHVLFEVERRRRRLGLLPLQALRAPRIRRSRLALEQRPDQVHQTQAVAEPEDRRAGRSTARSRSGTRQDTHGTGAACPGSPG